MKTSHRALNERFAFVVCKKQAEIKDPCIRSLICFVLFFLVPAKNRKKRKENEPTGGVTSKGFILDRKVNAYVTVQR